MVRDGIGVRMIEPSPDSLAALRAHPEVTGLFLDFDGTLSPVVPEPEDAEIVPGAAEVVEALADRYRIVAFISGRAAKDLWSRVRARGPRYFGLYGGEEMTPGGIRQSLLAPRWRKTARELAIQALEVIETQKLAGCEVELKDLAVSLHYRRTGREDPPASLLDWAQQAAGAAGFGAGVGRKVIELRPELVSKGETLQELVLETGIRNALVAGDDAADLEMMRAAVKSLPGVVVRAGIRSAEEPVGMGEQADIDVASPPEMLETLRLLL